MGCAARHRFVKPRGHRPARARIQVAYDVAPLNRVGIAPRVPHVQVAYDVALLNRVGIAPRVPLYKSRTTSLR